MSAFKLDGDDGGGDTDIAYTDGGSIISEPLRNHDGGSPLNKSMKTALGTGEHEALTVAKLCIGTSETDPSGMDSTVPLSPQWLTKSSDSKALLPPEPPRTPGSHGGASDSVSKERWRPDAHRDNDKRRDWRRPAADGDGGIGRRDRWREDEREGTQAGRRERWKDVGDGNNDGRRTDRWDENTSNARDSDTRRTPGPDSSNRDTASDIGHRGSKWSTRWGPEDKDKREKRLDNEKEGDSGQQRDRLHAHPGPGRAENDRETDSTTRDRWRAPSIASRGKGEVPPLGSTPPKYAPGFGVGRGRGESSAIGFTAGRGRSNFSSVGVAPALRPAIGASAFVDKSDAGQAYWYPRAKLLDIYRKCSAFSSFAEHPEGFLKAPQLTDAGPLEPLAFLTPDWEEEVVLEGIFKGDIVSSGSVRSAPKDSKHSEEVVLNQPKGLSNGGQERVLCNSIKNSNHGHESILQRRDTMVASQTEVMGGLDLVEPFDIAVRGESTPTKTSIVDVVVNDAVDRNGLTRQVSGMDVSDGKDQRQGKLPVLGQADDIENLGSRMEGQNLAGLFEKTLTMEIEKTNEVRDKYISMPVWDVPESEKWIEQEEKRETKVTHSPPEELSLLYIDPQGEIQGPFIGADIISWFDLGYFGTDLLVRLADAPENTSFTELGSVMPHLKLRGQFPPGMAASPSQFDETDRIVDKETLEYTRKVAVDSFQQGEVGGPSLLMHGNHGHVEISRCLPIDDSLLHNGRRADIGADQIQEVDRGENRAVPALWQNTSSFSDMKRENAELLKQSSFPQHRPAKKEFAQPVDAILRSNGHVSPRLPTPQSPHWSPGLQSDPAFSSLIKSKGWHDAAMSEGSSLPHPLDESQMHHLQHFENQQLQSQAGLTFPPPSQQQKHPLLELLNPQQRTSVPLEQLHNPVLAHDFNSNKMQKFAPHHPSDLLPPYPYAAHQEQQANFPLPASDALVGHIFKLQNQQLLEQQPHRHQQHPRALLDHLLKEQQRFPGATHSNVGAPQFPQDIASLDLQQLDELRQQRTLLEQLLPRRQQQEQFQAQQQARYLQQRQLKLDERRVSGVWEVDEYGHFVRTQASTPMQAHGVFHQQQQQQQEIFLPPQSSFSPMLQPQTRKLQLDAAALLGLNLQQPKADIRLPSDYQSDRDLTAFLTRASRMDSAPSDFLTHLQPDQGGFDRHSSLPDQGLNPSGMHIQRQSPAHEVGSRGWGSGSQSTNVNLMEMYQAVERISPVRANSYFKQNQLPGLNWVQDMASLNGYPQSSPVNREFLRQSPRENQGNSFRMQQELQGKRNGYGMDEDLSRVLMVSSPEKQAVFSASMSSNEDLYMSNLAGDGHHQVDSCGRIMHATPQAGWNCVTPARAQRGEADWQRAESTPQFDLLTATPPPRQPLIQSEASDVWGSVAQMQEQHAFVHSTFDIRHGDLALHEGAFGNGSVVTQSSAADYYPSSVARDVRESLTFNADEGEFMESKESKKNKKRNAKSKVSTAGKVASVTVSDAAIPLVSKPSKLPNMLEEDYSCAAPPAPSLGDFLLQKEEHTYLPPMPAWSVDPSVHVKVAKSLKDIQEAEKRARDDYGQPSQQQMHAPIALKPSNSIPISSNASAWQRPFLTSPSHHASQSRNQSSSLAQPGSGKSKMGLEDDDQFWDYEDVGASKQAFRMDWHDNGEQLKRDHSTIGARVKVNEHLPFQGSVGPLPPALGFSAAVSKQPSSKPANKQEQGPQPQLTVMQARRFRQWCEDQIRNFHGKGHMALLEFCMSLPSVSEAGDYLTMYLGDDPSVEAFKAEFIRHKGLIPPEVAQVVFPVSDAVIKDESADAHEGEARADTPSKKPGEEDETEFQTVRSGKRKGRKGKKAAAADPSMVLGFNVSNSNRILMGEIEQSHD